MKKTIYIFAFVFTLILLGACAKEGTGTGKSGGGETTEGETAAPEAEKRIIADGSGTEYILVLPLGAKSSLSGIAVELKSKVYDRTGKQLWVKYDKNQDEQECEILVGQTNRAQSSGSGALEANTYHIKFSGTKLLILAGTQNAAAAGLQYLIEHYLSGDGEKAFVLPADIDVKGVSTFPLSVACVGDSITYGVGAANRTAECYPAQLQKLLGDGYEVGNFGRSNAYMINKDNIAYTYGSDKSIAYTATAEYTKSLEFEPDIVVIMLGANDAAMASSNQSVKQKFIGEAQALYDSYAALASKPKVYFVLCTDRYGTGTGRSSLINIILPAIREVARENDCELIDVFAATNGYANAQSGWYSDSVHPSALGYTAVAKTIFEAIKE